MKYDTTIDTVDRELRLQLLKLSADGEAAEIIGGAQDMYDFVTGSMRPVRIAEEATAEATVSEGEKAAETPAPATLSGTLTPNYSNGVFMSSGDSIHAVGSTGNVETLTGAQLGDPGSQPTETQAAAQPEPETDPEPAPVRKARAPKKTKAKKARAARKTRGNGHAEPETNGVADSASATVSEAAAVAETAPATEQAAEQQMAA